MKGGVMYGKSRLDRAILRSWRRFNRHGWLYGDAVYIDSDEWKWELPDAEYVRQRMEYFRIHREKGYDAAQEYLNTVDNGK